jgi:hypothetical protein
MEKLISCLVIIVLTGVIAEKTNAQVTIGSELAPDRDAILDLKETETISQKGLRLPRVELQSTSSPAPLSAHKAGMQVFNVATAGDITPGIYINDGTKWIRIATGSSNSGTWKISGTNSIATQNTDNIYQMGRVSVNTPVAGGRDTSAVLNVVADDRGVLLPRVTLTAHDDTVTVIKPSIGLLVYNTGKHSGLPVDGYMYWNGEEWRVLYAITSAAPNANLQCGMASLEPDQTIIGGIGIRLGTIMKIPYTLGNGGMYDGCVLHSVGNPNITASISDGRFEYGAGFLAFYISGMPISAQNTPTGIEFDLTPFYQANPSIMASGCTTVKVGVEIKSDIQSVALIDNMKYTEESNSKGYAVQLTTPDGIFSVRAYIVSHDADVSSATFGTDNAYGINLQIRNNTSGNLIIAGEFDYEYHGGHGGSGVNALLLQPGKWSGDNSQNNENPISSPLWANYLDGSATVALAAVPSTNKTNRGRFIHWGNSGIYAAGAPERRTYSWTVNDGATTKTAYFMTFSSSATDASKYADATSCPNGICAGTKIFLKIDQVTAP